MLDPRRVKKPRPRRGRGAGCVADRSTPRFARVVPSYLPRENWPSTTFADCVELRIESSADLGGSWSEKKVPGEPPGDRVLALVLRGCNRRQMTTTFDCLPQTTVLNRGCQAGFSSLPATLTAAYWPHRRSLIASTRIKADQTDQNDGLKQQQTRP